MATQDAERAPQAPDVKAAHRAMWAAGDYPKLAREVIWDLGPALVGACGIGPGQRVLDVAAGNGNSSLRAAERGAGVVASDLTPELLEVGRSEAAQRGLEIEWRVADAEALPFADGEFDVVMSSIGAMFAPDHQAVADELVRVCRPGGTIGMINWTPEGWVGEFFATLAPYAPPPPPNASGPPVLWGTEGHVHELFGDRVSSLETSKHVLVADEFADPGQLCEYYKAYFGPVMMIYAGVAEDPERLAALDRDFLDFATRTNRGGPDGPAVYEFEYLLVVAQKGG